MNEHDHDVDMREEYDFSEARRGPVVTPMGGKTRITIRLDNDILTWFRDQVHEEGGGNYQTLINHALREHISRAQSKQQQAKSYNLRWERLGSPRNLAQVSPANREERNQYSLSFEELVRQIVREELERAK